MRRVPLSVTERSTTYYVGIDVSKAALDVAILPTAEHFVVSNDEVGIDELVDKLAQDGSEALLVVLEASGGFERPVAATLAASGIALFVVNPRQARDFAKATGRLAKTDAPDAFVLAHFAEAIRPTPRAIPDAEVRDFQESLPQKKATRTHDERREKPSRSKQLQSRPRTHPSAYKVARKRTRSHRPGSR